MSETDKRPLKVFLCHAHADRDAVRGLYTRLTKDSVDAWLDKEKLLPGENWRNEIRKAVQQADVVVVCHSKEFNQQGFRQREVRWALDTAMEKPEGEIFIIPARLEVCDVLDSLSDWHWVDLFEDDGYEMLMKALRVRASRIGAVLQIGSATPQSSQKVIKPVDNGLSAFLKLDTEELLRVPQEQLRKFANMQFKKRDRQVNLSKLYAMKALARISSSQKVSPFWKPPYGEPEWVTIPQGTFWMGSEAKELPKGMYDLKSPSSGEDEKPVHRLYLPEFQISRVPITNAQYEIYIKDSGAKPPKEQHRNHLPIGLEELPVTKVSWYEALDYCKWLGEKINKLVSSWCKTQKQC